MDLCPGVEPLRFRANLLNSKRFSTNVLNLERFRTGLPAEKGFARSLRNLLKFERSIRNLKGSPHRHMLGTALISVQYTDFVIAVMKCQLRKRLHLIENICI